MPSKRTNLLTKIIVGNATEKDFFAVTKQYSVLKKLIKGNEEMFNRFNMELEFWDASILFFKTKLTIEENLNDNYRVYIG
jgi:hypothetical protein